MAGEKNTYTDVTANTTKVGLLITGVQDDRSFCQSHYDALKSLKDEFNLEIVVREYAQEDETAYDKIVGLIKSDGCKIIIAASYNYGEYVKKAAKNYPDVYFINSTGVGKSDNLSSCMGRMYQARYLSGIVAGMKTETGEIGYVAAFPNSEVIRGINAFTLGVKSVRDDAAVHVKYCNSWVADEISGKVANDLMDNYPIDVLTVHSNSMQPNLEAEKRGVWAIGYNMDNAELFPGTYLTACVWNWQYIYHDQILRCLQGKFYGTDVWTDLEYGSVGLSDFTSNVAEGTKEAVEAVKAEFESREFDVFYGPVTDNNGNIRIEEGESMSDDEMLNGFDWYVEGVYVEE